MFPDQSPGEPGAMPDLQSLLQQAASMQEQVMAAQERLAEARVEGSAGGGSVSATVSGTGELIGLSIDPSVCDPAESELLADLVLAAVRDASVNAQQLAADQLGAFTEGFGAPGLDGGGLGDGGRGGQPPGLGQLGF